MAEELRGIIDRFEGDLAAIVFDDDQRLDLPRDQLPAGARAGDAIIIRIGDSGVWRGQWRESDKIELENGQSIRWPGERGEGDAWLSIAIDPEDTAARKQRVRSLLDDIFKSKPRPE